MTPLVAHVNVARGYRGGERQTELLIHELERLGARQVLVARKDGLLAARLSTANVEIRNVSGNPLGVALACGGVDIVHVHEGRSVYGAYIRSLISGTPYLVTRRVNNPLRDHWLCHQAYRRAHTVAAVAPQVGDVLRRFDPRIDPQTVYSSSSGLPVDEVHSREIRKTYPGKYLVGHVGALDNAQKGQEFILSAARRLRRSHPEIHFILVGGGEDEEMLRRAAAGLDNVTFTGFVDSVGDYLSAFDLFILPSRREGIGSILLDAMEQGLPVIASNVGGVPEIVRDGENGILIEPAQTERLQAAILRLRSDPMLAARMGERGRKIAAGFTARVMGKKYWDIYRDILERAGNAQARASNRSRTAHKVE